MREARVSSGSGKCFMHEAGPISAREEAQPSARRSLYRSGLSSAGAGAASELEASAWLIRKGFDVYRNVSATGPVDLVAIDSDGSVTLYDIKSSPTSPTPAQAAIGVKTLFPDGNGGWRSPREGTRDGFENQ